MKHVLVMLALLFFLSGPASAEAPARIVSLAPNLTEILYDLGLGDRIAAVTIFCDYPAQAREKPKIGGLANPSLEAIVAMRPDMVVMTDDGNPAGLESRLRKLGIGTYIFRAKRLSELPAGIRDLGIALGAREPAFHRADVIEKSLHRLGKGLAEGSPRRAKEVLFVVQPNPLIVAGPGTAIDDSLKLLGLKNIASDAGSRYPNYSLEEVIVRAPGTILFGQGPGMSNEYAANVLKKLGSLDAVKKGRVCFIKDPLFRLGPRIIEGINEIRECVGGKESLPID